MSSIFLINIISIDFNRIIELKSKFSNLINKNPSALIQVKPIDRKCKLFRYYQFHGQIIPIF
jgi:hypothetical protein